MTKGPIFKENQTTYYSLTDDDELRKIEALTYEPGFYEKYHLVERYQDHIFTETNDVGFRCLVVDFDDLRELAKFLKDQCTRYVNKIMLKDAQSNAAEECEYWLQHTISICQEAYLKSSNGRMLAETINWCESKGLELLNSYQPQEQETENQSIQETTFKLFTDYFYNLADKETFAEKLKQEFKTDKGKNIAILIILLTEKEMIALGNTELRKFLETMSYFFNQRIGYESVRKYSKIKIGDIAHEKSIKAIEKRLNHVIKSCN